MEATLTVQEEVGERGAMAAVDNIDADVCIAFEGCPADDTFSPDYMIQTALRKGPMLRHFDCSMITNPAIPEICIGSGRRTWYSGTGIRKKQAEERMENTSTHHVIGVRQSLWSAGTLYSQPRNLYT